MQYIHIGPAEMANIEPRPPSTLNQYILSSQCEAVNGIGDFARGFVKNGAGRMSHVAREHDIMQLGPCSSGGLRGLLFDHNT